MKTKILLGSILALAGGATLMAEPGATLREACAAGAEAGATVYEAGEWLYLPAELRHVAAGKFWGPEATEVSRATRPENADPLPAILDFKAQLDAAGIELVIVPVPAKAFVYPEPILGDELAAEPPERLDRFHQAFYAELERRGVTVLDLMPDFLAARSQEKMYCQTDTHWSGLATVLAAERIADFLKDRPWLAGRTRLETTAEVREMEIKGDLARMQEASDPETEIIRMNFVTADAGGSVSTDPESPVLLMGDSHTLVFHAGGDMLASGAGLADQLMHQLGIPVDLIGVRGSGATPARINLLRKVRGDDAYLQKKKAVIWCFSVREFTESSGWSKVPIVK